MPVETGSYTTNRFTWQASPIGILWMSPEIGKGLLVEVRGRRTYLLFSEAPRGPEMDEAASPRPVPEVPALVSSREIGPDPFDDPPGRSPPPLPSPLPRPYPPHPTTSVNATMPPQNAAYQRAFLFT